MTMPWWCLMVVDRTGGQHRIFGPKHKLMPFYEQWAKKDFLDGQVLTIEGTADSCDRAPLFASFDPEFIGAVHLSLYS